MQKNKTTSIIRGVGLGMAVGGSMAVIGSIMATPNSKSHLKRSASKAMKAIGEMFGNMQYMMKS